MMKLIKSPFPPKLYCVIMNLGKLIHKKVYTLEVGEAGYWSRGGNVGFGFDEGWKYGLNNNRGYHMFLTVDKTEAETFLAGALALYGFMKERWFK
jgi:hypothetical protein